MFWALRFCSTKREKNANKFDSAEFETQLQRLGLTHTGEPGQSTGSKWDVRRIKGSVSDNNFLD